MNGSPPPSMRTAFRGGVHYWYFGFSSVYVHKASFITRDLDLLMQIHARSRLSVHVSLITTDRELARCLEPRAPTPEARLRGIARLRAHGIEVGVNVMHVLPGITDAQDMIEELVRSLKSADASCVSTCALRLQASARDRYVPFIAQEFPELAARYRRAYASSHQVGERYRVGLQTRFAEVCGRYDVPFGRDHRPGETDEDEELSSVGVADGNRAQLALEF